MNGISSLRLIAIAISIGAISSAYAQQATSVAERSVVQMAVPDFTNSIARSMANPSKSLATPLVVKPMSSAPPLSRELVYAVGSSQYGGWEYMTTIGQYSTVGNHGGAMLRVVVQEVGYGGTPIAHMAGALLATSKNYQNDAFCVVGGYYTTPCPAGYTIAGWYRYFNLDGYQSGSFTYQNTSLNSPFNTLTTSIYIQ